MYDERELTVEQIGKVLGMTRTSVYQALGQSPAPRPADMLVRSGCRESRWP